jgi:hypothetical protein
LGANVVGIVPGQGEGHEGLRIDVGSHIAEAFVDIVSGLISSAATVSGTWRLSVIMDEWI